MESDLISVLIPAYNVEKYLARCLRSVLKQTYQNLEIVVVDDGSADRTYAIAKQFADTDQRIVLLQKANEENVAKARNYLLDHCHGKYCVWVDSDDCIKPRYVEKLYQALTSHKVDLAACKFAVRFFPFPVLPPIRSVARDYSGDEILPQVIYRTAIVLWNKMYRTDLINQDEPIRFDEKYCYGEDLLFNLRYLKRCQKIVCLNDRLYNYFWRSGSESHKKFSCAHLDLINKLIQLCETETNPSALDTLTGWTAFNCCAETFLASKQCQQYDLDHFKQFAYQNRHVLYKNRLAKPLRKCILWVGLKTWCRWKKPVNFKNKGN